MDVAARTLVITITVIGVSVGIASGYALGFAPPTLALPITETATPAYTIYLPFISHYCLPFPPPSPTPSFFWATCFNSLKELGNSHLDRQGTYSLVDDPTGSGRGKVLKCDASPDLAYFDPQYTPDGRTVVRSYPYMYFPQKNGVHSVGLDVYVMNDFSPAIQSASDGPHLSLLSDFYNAGYGAAGWIIGVTADLQLIRGEYFLALGNVKNRQFLPDAVPFTFDRWHRIEIVVTEQRQVRLYQDGQLVNVAELRDAIGVATGGGHPGLYGLSANGAHVAPFNTGTLYNDNWTMAIWSSQ